MEQKKVYKALKSFHESQWKIFARVHLGLDPEYIGNMFKSIQCVEEVKYQIFTNWQKKKGATTEGALEKLTTLKKDFFFSKTETLNPIQQQSDDTDSRHTDYVYSLRNNKGVALIIGNSFEKSNAPRPECQIDMDNMKELWSEIIGCDLVDKKIHVNQTADEMKDLLRKVGGMKDYDYVVVVISTHGGLVPVKQKNANGNHGQVSNLESDTDGGQVPVKQENANGNHGQVSNPESDTDGAKVKVVNYEEVLYGDDLSQLKATDIQKIYDNENARNLQDKPKLFILQYCRGKKIDEGVNKAFGEDSTDPDKEEDFQKIEPSYPNPDPLMPSMSDILTIYPTHSNYAALRNPEKGSWIIHFVYEIFKKNYNNMHVTDMLTIVNNWMKNRRGKVDGKHCKVMSVYESSLTKNFYLKTKE